MVTIKNYDKHFGEVVLSHLGTVNLVKAEFTSSNVELSQ